MQNDLQQSTDSGTQRNLGRRGFLTLSALAAGGSALGGLDTVAGAPTDEQLFGTARWSTFRSILPDDGGALLTGIRTNSVGEQVGWAVRLDDDLDVLWNRAYLSPPHLRSSDRGEDHDGIEFALPDGDDGFVLVGWWHTLGSDSRYGWVTWVGSDGIPWLTRVYNRENVDSFRDDFADGVVTDDGFLLVGRTIAGEYLDERRGDGWIVEIDGNRRGRVLWERAYDPSGTGNGLSDNRHSEFNAVTAVDGGYLVVGETSPDGPTRNTNTAAWALRIDADGDQRWSRTFRLDDGRDNEFRDVVAVDDGFLVAGVAGNDENVTELHDYEMRGRSWAAKLDRQGRMVWQDAPGGDGFHAVEQRGNGAVFVGRRNGRGWGVAYNANGNRIGSDGSSVSGSRYYAVATRGSGSQREFLPVGHGRRGGTTSGLLSQFGAFDGGNGGGDDDDDDDEPAERLFELVATERGEVRYEFTVDGDAEGVRVNSRVKAEDSDRIRENGDGTVTVTGTTGNPGYGDAFRITGEITEFSASGEAAFFVRIDGDRVDVDELGDGDGNGDGDDGDGDDGDGNDGGGDDDDNGNGDDAEERLFELVATEVGEIRYEFVVDGAAEGVRVNSRVKAEDDDRVRENDDGTVTVQGQTGNPGYGDAFRITGDVVAFESQGDVDFFIRLDGERVSVEELVED